MNLAQFKSPVSHVCLAGPVVAFWSLEKEVARLSPFNDQYILSTFSHTHKVGNNGINANFVSPHICSFLHYLYLKMLVL